MKRISFFYAFLMLFSTVSGAPTIRFRVLFPAPVGLPQSLHSLAIIDRSVPENKTVNIIEGILTGEGIGEDKMASQISIDGLLAVMQNSERFSVIRTTESLKGSNLGNVFPPPLPWEQVEELCRKYHTDGILCLENFDSDFIVTQGSQTSDQKDSEGRVVKVTTFTANGVATVNVGFRIYDPSIRSIIDEHHFSHHMDWDGSGSTADAALRSLTAKSEAIRQVSYNSGEMYARRVTPSWYMVVRTYYKKSKRDPDLAEGARMMEINDWDEALLALQKAVGHGHVKTRGRAAHNIAVVYEILGDFENAKKWAQDAYARYGNKASKNYLYELNDRARNQEVLEQQLNP